MNEPVKPSVLDKIIEAGSKGGWALALIVGLAGIALAALAIYTRPDVPIVGTPPATTELKVVAATGEEGFKVYEFCDDPSTSVRETPSPDASGVTYELKRVKDGVTETVTVVFGQAGDVLYAKHFSDQAGGQESQPAFVTEKARGCIEDKS